MSSDTSTVVQGPSNDDVSVEPGNDIRADQSSVAQETATVQPTAATQPGAASVAATAWEEETADPDDDIGNRIDGPAHHERTAFHEQNISGSAKRNKESRQRSGHKSAQPSGSPPAKQRPVPRERPVFHVGEEVFGKVVEVLDDAIVIDLNGKAKAIFDRHELTGEPPKADDQFIAQVHGDGGRGGLVVLTRKPERQEDVKPRVMAAVDSGELVHGLVTGTIKGGVEVDVDGLRAFAPASHMELRLGANLSHLIGKRFPFKVIKYAKNGKEVVLSRKEQLEQEAEQARQQGLAKLPIGEVVDAVVRTIVDWGVFVAIPSADNIEGLVHISELSYERGSKPSDLFEVGATTQVKVLRIDEKGKLWLSRKAVTGDPWQADTDRFAVGSKHTGTVVRIQPFGAFVQLAPGVDGLIRTADLVLGPDKEGIDAVSVGQSIDVVVTHVDLKDHRIALHPFVEGQDSHPPQKLALYRVVKVQVVEAQPAGLVVRVLGATGASSRGFIPAGHTGTAKGTELRREFPAGTELEAKIIELDPKRGGCKLSLRAIKEDTEKAAYQEYRSKVAREAKFGTLGDLLAKRRS